MVTFCYHLGMPRIEAPTVVEHRAARERALLASATRLLRQGGADAITLAAVADDVGLTRTAVYKYFPSVKELRHRVIADSFSSWAAIVAKDVAVAKTPAECISIFTRSSLRLASNGHHRAAVALGRLETDLDLADQHALLRAPLVASLRALGVSQPLIEAELIDAIIGRAISLMDDRRDSAAVEETTIALVDDLVASR